MLMMETLKKKRKKKVIDTQGTIKKINMLNLFLSIIFIHLTQLKKQIAQLKVV